MSSKVVMFTVVAGSALLAPVLHAQPAAAPEDALDVTMVILPEHATEPGEITRRIELPPARGRQDAENRGRPAERIDSDDRGRPPDGRPEGAGRETADQARQRGRESGQQVSDQAREDREQAERGKPSEPPGRPDAPGNSNPPGRPDAPGNSNPAPGRPDSPGNSNPTPGRPDSPGNSNPTPGRPDLPGNSNPTPGRPDSPGNSNPPERPGGPPRP